jgi:hypothetical protein
MPNRRHATKMGVLLVAQAAVGRFPALPGADDRPAKLEC